MNSNCSNVLILMNLQELVKKAFCYQKLFWPFTVWISCSSHLKIFANSRPSASNFKSFYRSLEHFFLTVGQNNFGNKIPLLLSQTFPWESQWTFFLLIPFLAITVHWIDRNRFLFGYQEYIIWIDIFGTILLKVS